MLHGLCEQITKSYQAWRLTRLQHVEIRLNAHQDDSVKKGFPGAIAALVRLWRLTNPFSISLWGRVYVYILFDREYEQSYNV